MRMWNLDTNLKDWESLVLPHMNKKILDRENSKHYSSEEGTVAHMPRREEEQMVECSEW